MVPIPFGDLRQSQPELLTDLDFGRVVPDRLVVEVSDQSAKCVVVFLPSSVLEV